MWHRVNAWNILHCIHPWREIRFSFLCDMFVSLRVLCSIQSPKLMSKVCVVRIIYQKVHIELILKLYVCGWILLNPWLLEAGMWQLIHRTRTSLVVDCRQLVPIVRSSRRLRIQQDRQRLRMFTTRHERV